jgi:hypothetical protein
MHHEEFAERAAERLELVADALKDEQWRIGRGTVSIRANEMSVVARMVRDTVCGSAAGGDPVLRGAWPREESRLVSNRTG